MKTATSTKTSSLAVVVVMAACSSGPAPEADIAALLPAAAPLPDELSLPTLGLRINAPAGSEMSLGKVTKAADTIVINGPDLAVTVYRDDSSEPENASAYWTDLKATKPHEQTLPDGWAATWESAEFNLGRWVMVRRTIGGKTYFCQGAGGEAIQQANGLATCKTLRR